MSVKINKLEIENVKRVKAVKIEPTINGLTILGGDNNQGKTTVLDSIAWALGGNKYRPSQAHREGSVTPPHIHMTLSNGLVVERKGKNSDLKVTDPSGDKAGQNLLDSFVEELSLNLPKFMDATNKEKANTLLQIIGVGEKLLQLEQHETKIYNERRAIGQIADQKEKFAKEQPYYPEAPKDMVSINDLIREQQTILARNGENQRKRQNLTTIQATFERQSEEIKRVEAQLVHMKEKLEATVADLDIAKRDALTLQDESTAELEKSIQEIETINRKVVTNMDKDKAETDALEQRNKYATLSVQLEGVRKQKEELLANADLPLPGLTVAEGELLYNNQKWDNMSGSDQLKVSTAIVRKLKPQCGFILLDKLEQMDQKTLEEFGVWLEQEGLQAIATRVSRGEECTILIQDGYVVGQDTIPTEQDVPQAHVQTWKAGEF